MDVRPCSLWASCHSFNTHLLRNNPFLEYQWLFKKCPFWECSSLICEIVIKHFHVLGRGPAPLLNKPSGMGLCGWSLWTCVLETVQERLDAIWPYTAQKFNCVQSRNFWKNHETYTSSTPAFGDVIWIFSIAGKSEQIVMLLIIFLYGTPRRLPFPFPPNVEDIRWCDWRGGPAIEISRVLVFSSPEAEQCCGQKTLVVAPTVLDTGSETWAPLRSLLCKVGTIQTSISMLLGTTAWWQLPLSAIPISYSLVWNAFICKLGVSNSSLLSTVWSFESLLFLRASVSPFTKWEVWLRKWFPQVPLIRTASLNVGFKFCNL